MNILLRHLVLCLVFTTLWSQERPDSTATVIFAGDLNFAEHFENASKHHPIDVFARWRKIGKYDFMMVNLENAVTRSIDSAKKEFVFKMKSGFLRFFSEACISIVNCANNHTADFRINGVLETIRQLDSAGVKHVGIGRNFGDARKPVILKVNNIRIGFLGYADISTYIATKHQPGRTPLRAAIILEDIKRLRSSVDFIVINLHWGEELAEQPDESQISLAHRIIDGGADLIIGHHPHVLQGIEQYHGKIIAYSLGNFIFGGNINSANSETAVLKVYFKNKGINVEAVPICIHNWQPEPADSIAVRRISQRLQERSKIFPETISYISKE